MSRGEVKKTRKIRSDKKRDVQPTVSIELKDCIYRVSYITDRPVKDIAEDICRIGVSNKDILNSLSTSFRRDVRIDSTLYIGDINRESNRVRNKATEKGRITIRFKSGLYEMISALAYALDCSVARACGMLLGVCMGNIDVLSEVLGDSLNSFDGSKMKELRKVIEYTGVIELYDERMNLTDIIKLLVNRFKMSKKTKSNIDELDSEENDNIKITHWRDIE